MDIVNIFLEKFLTVILSIIVTGCTGYLTALIKNERKARAEIKADNARQDQALLALLHDRLYQACQYYITRNNIEIDELDNLKHMYEPYTNLGGNGVCKRLYERCLDLPIVEVTKDLQGTTRIIEIIEAEDDSGFTIIPTFEEWR